MTAIVKGFGCRPVVIERPVGPVVRAGVRKPPRKEPAGRCGAVCRVWGDLIGGAVSEGWDRRRGYVLSCRSLTRIGRCGCTRRHDRAATGAIVSALAVTGTTVVRRRDGLFRRADAATRR